MGACFSKVFNGCPLHINASASWIEPESRDQIIFIGAEEGIYALNLNEMHEGILELVSIFLTALRPASYSDRNVPSIFVV